MPAVLLLNHLDGVNCSATLQELIYLVSVEPVDIDDSEEPTAVSKFVVVFRLITNRYVRLF